MVTIYCLPLQENPYLFTYKNSKYLPRLLHSLEKLEVGGGFLGLTNKRANEPAAGPPAGSLEPSTRFSRSRNPVSRMERVQGQVCGCPPGCLKQVCPTFRLSNQHPEASGVPASCLSILSKARPLRPSPNL